jgi:hypothetical protein
MLKGYHRLRWLVGECGDEEDMREILKSTSDWLVKKYKVENKTLLHETDTYITTLFLHIVATHILVLVS